MPEFHASYGPVRFRPLDRTDLRPTMYVRRDSVNLGFRSDSASLAIPAILLASFTNAEMTFASNGALVLPVHARQSARYRVLAEDFDAGEVELIGDSVERVGVGVRREDAYLLIALVNASRDPALIEGLVIRKRARVDPRVQSVH